MSTMEGADANDVSITDDDTAPVISDVIPDTAGCLAGSRPRLMIIATTVGYYLALGFSAYVVPEYIHKSLDDQYGTKNNFTYNECHGVKSGPGYERYRHVQEETTKWLNYMSIARNTPAIFSTLIWVSYSDVVGRKAMMVLVISGYTVRLLIITLVVRFHAHFSLMLIGSVIEGICGTVPTFLAIMFSLIADLTDSTGQQRTMSIVVAEITLGMLITVSSLCAGYYIQYTGFFAPVLTAFCLSLASVAVGILFLPETLHRRQKPGGIRPIFTSIIDAFNVYLKPESKLVRLKYFLLIASFIFYSFQGLNRGSLETVYQLGRPFCWSASKIGWFGSAASFSISFVGMGTVYLLKRRLADDTIAVICCIVNALSFTVEGLATTTPVLYIVTVLTTLALIPLPMTRSLLSKLTPADKQGAMFSVSASVEAICSVVTTLSTNEIYVATLSIMNGFVFLILAFITAISAAFLGGYMYVQRRHGNETENGKPPVELGYTAA